MFFLDYCNDCASRYMCVCKTCSCVRVAEAVGMWVCIHAACVINMVCVYMCVRECVCVCVYGIECVCMCVRVRHRACVYVRACIRTWLRVN